LSSGAGFNEDYTTIHDLFLWNPTGDGRSNLSQISTTGTMKDTPLNDVATYWNYTAGPVPVAFASYGNIHSATHDPDVRALYPDAPCRTTHAKCVVDVNMGGGAATLRAVPFTKDMASKTPAEIRAEMLSDRHVVTIFDIGGKGHTDRRITFSKWVQSRKAVGEFTTAKLAVPTQPVDQESGIAGYSALYTDEFCYGGWIFLFENIAPAMFGSVPYMRAYSVVDIQVQLSLGDNHLKEPKNGVPFDKFLRDHEKLSGNPPRPSMGPVTGTPAQAAEKKSGDTSAGKGPKKAAPKQGPKPRQGKNGPRKSVTTYQGPPGHIRRGPNMRGSLPQQQQRAKSQAAQQNRAATMNQVKQIAENLYRNRGKPKAQGLLDKLFELAGGSPAPRRFALREGGL